MRVCTSRMENQFYLFLKKYYFTLEINLVLFHFLKLLKKYYLNFIQQRFQSQAKMGKLKPTLIYNVRECFRSIETFFSLNFLLNYCLKFSKNPENRHRFLNSNVQNLVTIWSQSLWVKQHDIYAVVEWFL